MYTRVFLAMGLMLAAASGVHQANAIGWSGTGQQIAHHAAEATTPLVVPVATSALTRGEKRIVRKIRSHNKEMRRLGAKMKNTTNRLKRKNAKMKR